MSLNLALCASSISSIFLSLSCNQFLKRGIHLNTKFYKSVLAIQCHLKLQKLKSKLLWTVRTDIYITSQKILISRKQKIYWNVCFTVVPHLMKQMKMMPLSRNRQNHSLWTKSLKNSKNYVSDEKTCIRLLWNGYQRGKTPESNCKSWPQNFTNIIEM